VAADQLSALLGALQAGGFAPIADGAGGWSSRCPVGGCGAGDPLGLHRPLAINRGGDARCSECGADQAAVEAALRGLGLLDDDSDALLPPIPVFPVSALPGPAVGLVRKAERSGLPGALMAGAALGAITGAIGSRASIDLLSPAGERAALWFVLIGPAGCGKSPALRAAMAPIADYEAGRPVEERVTCADSTVEALFRLLALRDGASLAAHDELAVFLRGANEYKRGHGGDLARFLQIWTGALLDYTRVGGGGREPQVSLVVDRPTLSIVGGLQPHLVELLGDAESGFRPRWLPFVAPPASPVADALPRPIRHPDYDSLVARLLAARGERRRWDLDSVAAAEFASARARWKAEARGAGAPAAVAGAAAKADVHAARLALVFAEADNPGRGGLITAGQVRRAAAVIDYALDVWRALPSPSGLALTQRDAKLDQAVDRLVAWLEQQPDGLATRRQALRAHAGGARTPADLEAVLGRFGSIYRGCVFEAKPARGPLTTMLKAPRRALSVATGDSKGPAGENPRVYGDFVPPDAGDSFAGDSFLATVSGAGDEEPDPGGGVSPFVEAVLSRALGRADD